MSDQCPIGSGFGAASTVDEVIAGRDLTGKVAIVTGGYAGLGLVAASTLADAGAEVIVPARDRGKAAAALKDFPKLRLETMDLMEPASIDAFAERFLASGRPLHILMNNAGIMAAPLARDSRGFESQFSTNHLGHFQLTCRLWPALRRTQGARVVSLSSSAHTFRGALDLDDLHWTKRKYDPWGAYNASKTANVLFAVELDRRGRDEGVRAFSVHPGAIPTELGRFIGKRGWQLIGVLDDDGEPVVDPKNGRKSPAQGAATQVWCATSPQLDELGGVYCEDCEVATAVANDAPPGRGAKDWATDPEIAAKLWALSEDLAGARLN
jgi:NAD(P)-dependent dehydrogenase (short-subunit alcohol dehydrogenase family)